MKYLLIVVLGLALLQGCATGYKSGGFFGGYSETQLDENIFKVTFKGNEHTSKERAADFTLLRSAELALRSGYKYFTVIDAESYTTDSTYTAPTTTNTTGSVHGSKYFAHGNSTTTTYGGHTYNISKPSTSNTIVCFKQKPENVFSYNAEIIYRNLMQKYDIAPAVN